MNKTLIVEISIQSSLRVTIFSGLNCRTGIEVDRPRSKRVTHLLMGYMTHMQSTEKHSTSITEVRGTYLLAVPPMRIVPIDE